MLFRSSKLPQGLVRADNWKPWLQAGKGTGMVAVMLRKASMSYEAERSSPDPQTLGREILSLLLAQGPSWGSGMGVCMRSNERQGDSSSQVVHGVQGCHEAQVPHGQFVPGCGM